MAPCGIYMLFLVGLPVIGQKTSSIDDISSCFLEQYGGYIMGHLQLQQDTVNRVTKSQEDLEEGQTGITIEQGKANQRIDNLERKQAEIKVELNRTQQRVDDVERGPTITMGEDGLKILIQRIDGLEKRQNLLEQLIKENLNLVSCPSGFELNNGTKSCYYLTNIKKDWTDARNYCRDQGADLVSVETEAEHLFLKEMIRRKVATGNYQGYLSYWTSGNDAETEGTFVWEATGQALSYNGWNSGEPNRFQDKDEDCIGLYSSGLGFNDEKCHLLTFFICEMEIQ